MKSTVNIYFETPFDEESIKIHATLSEEEKKNHLENWKKYIEDLINNEFGGIKNLKVQIDIVEQ